MGGSAKWGIVGKGAGILEERCLRPVRERPVGFGPEAGPSIHPSLEQERGEGEGEDEQVAGIVVSAISSPLSSDNCGFLGGIESLRRRVRARNRFRVLLALDSSSVSCSSAIFIHPSSSSSRVVAGLETPELRPRPSSDAARRSLRNSRLYRGGLGVGLWLALWVQEDVLISVPKTSCDWLEDRKRSTIARVFDTGALRRSCRKRGSRADEGLEGGGAGDEASTSL